MYQCSIDVDALVASTKDELAKKMPTLPEHFVLASSADPGRLDFYWLFKHLSKS